MDVPLPGVPEYVQGPQRRWAVPATIRSRVMLEVAAELVAAREQPLRQVRVQLREQSTADGWPLTLFASSGIEGIEAVVDRKAAMAIVNPANMLMLAANGKGPFRTPLPVRAIAVIPSHDVLTFAVRPEVDARCVEEIAERRLPLRIALRGQEGHSLHTIIDDVLAAAGFSLRDVWAAGGEIRREGLLPLSSSSKFAAFVNGDIDAIFDEGTEYWIPAALDHGMRVLPLREATIRKLEAAGYRRGYLTREMFPALGADVLSVDFSGWPIFVHAELHDELVRSICAALVTRKHFIPWDGEGALPIERMCRESPDTPQLVALHAAAARYWRELGFV
jgi:TRAP-type uncharacterized transport system substrate-binding protein